MSSVVAAHRLTSCPVACGIFLGPGIEAIYPTLAGRFLTTGPPGKSNFVSLSSQQSAGDIVCCCCWVAKSCPTLCNSMDHSLPGSSVHGISQAWILEWVVISFSRGSFLTQGSNPSLLHWQADSLPLSHLGSDHFVVKGYFRWWCRKVDNSVITSLL